jgi:similar to stage IV sporulation protein
LEHILYGFLVVELRGEQIQAVLSSMYEQGVALHDVSTRDKRFVAGVSLRDFDALYRSCRKHRVKMRFLRREGLPFVLRSAKRRKAWLVGAALFFAIVYAMGGLVWQVDVSGVEDETRMAVLQAARDAGIYRGAWKRSLGTNEQMQSQLLKRLPNLMWVGVQVEGTKVNIEAVEKIPDTDPLQSRPHNVIAGKPGVIRRVFANRGNVVVKTGQVVHPGEVVISGALGGGSKFVPAEGKVLAEVWYQSTITVPLSVRQSALTGEHTERKYLAIGGFAIRIWGFEQPQYLASIEREDTHTWKLGSWELPIQLKDVTLYEVSPAEERQSQLQAEQTALELAAQDVRAQMNGDGTILGQRVLHREVRHGKLYATILTRTEEDIGVTALVQAPSPES